MSESFLRKKPEEVKKQYKKKGFKNIPGSEGGTK